MNTGLENMEDVRISFDKRLLNEDEVSRFKAKLDENELELFNDYIEYIDDVESERELAEILAHKYDCTSRRLRQRILSLRRKFLLETK